MKERENWNYEFTEGGGVWNTDSFGTRDSLVRMPVTGEDLLWKKIRNEAKTNPALQEMLNQILIMYTVIKD